MSGLCSFSESEYFEISPVLKISPEQSNSFASELQYSITSSFKSSPIILQSIFLSVSDNNEQQK